MQKPKISSRIENEIVQYLRGRTKKIPWWVKVEEVTAYKVWLASRTEQKRRRAATVDRKSLRTLRKEITEEARQEHENSLNKSVYTRAQMIGLVTQEVDGRAVVIFGRSPWAHTSRHGYQVEPSGDGEVWCLLANYWPFMRSGLYERWQICRREASELNPPTRSRIF